MVIDKLLIKNVLSNIIGKIFGGFSSFIFIPLYIKYLGLENFSLISFTIAIAGFMIFLDGGLTASITRELSNSNNSNNLKAKIFKTLESTYFLIIILTTVLLLFLSENISDNFINSKLYSTKELSYFLNIISFGIGFEMLFRFYLGGLVGLEKQVLSNTYRISWGLVRNGLVIFFISVNQSLSFFFMWQTLTSLAFIIIIKLKMNHVIFGSYIINISPKIEFSILKKIYKFALGMLLISLVAAFNSQLDKIFISKNFDVSLLGYYTLAVTISTGIYLLINPISVALTPRFTSLITSGSIEKAMTLYSRISFLSAIVIFSISTQLFFFSKEIFWVWIGDKNLAIETAHFLPVISFAYSMIAITIIPFSIAFANGYTKLNNVLGLITLLITIPGYIYFIKYFGPIGAAYTFCFVQILVSIIYIYFIKKKFLKSISSSTIYLKNLLYPLVISFFVAIVIDYFTEFKNSFSRLETFYFLVLSTVFVFSINLLILSYRDIKKLFIQYCK
mgnify:CR=1 FL=1